MSSQVAISQPVTEKHPSAKILNYRKVKISKEGEILVKGETLFKGYLDTDNLNLPLDDEGWFHTGDLGCLTGEGQLQVSGRKDNMFISGGENIQPEEIERCLCQLEEIEKASVVPVENKEFGHRPVAFIKWTQNSTLNKEMITAFLQGHLPKFKIPEQFYIWPKGIVENEMKVRRSLLSQLVRDKDARLQSIN